MNESIDCCLTHSTQPEYEYPGLFNTISEDQAIKGLTHNIIAQVEKNRCRHIVFAGIRILT